MHFSLTAIQYTFPWNFDPIFSFEIEPHDAMEFQVNKFVILYSLRSRQLAFKLVQF